MISLCPTSRIGSHYPMDPPKLLIETDYYGDSNSTKPLGVVQHPQSRRWFACKIGVVDLDEKPVDKIELHEKQDEEMINVYTQDCLSQ